MNTHHAGHTHQARGGLVDPVCGMSVTDQSLHRARHDEHDYFFCSAGCRTKFVAEPAKYIDGQGPRREPRQSRAAAANTTAIYT